MTATTSGRLGTTNVRDRLMQSPLTSVASVWVGSAITALVAPDMITGSQHEHLPIALMTVWLWACVGSIYALMTPQRASRAGWTFSVAVVWGLMALVAILAPVMVTGTDPTSIPLAAIIAPPVAAVVTGMLSLRQANLPNP